MLVDEAVLPVAEQFRLGEFSSGDALDQRFQSGGGVVQRILAGKDSGRVEVDVLFHSRKRSRIACDLEQRGNRAADDGAAAGDEQDNLRACRDEVHDAFAVVRVGISELHEVFIGHGIQQPKAGVRRL